MEKNEIMIVELGVRTLIGKRVQMEGFPEKEGYLVLKNIRVIQGQMVPMQTNITPINKNSAPTMGYALCLYPYATESMIFYEENIKGFIPLLPESAVYKMYMEEMKNLNQLN